ncbi:MAG: hypothetical protein LBL39_07320 [Planctomycetaceae bacterium]|jgi:hypothetical protein|nr:hypothetical protein [Planctomycetaceae bacterium]
MAKKKVKKRTSKKSKKVITKSVKRGRPHGSGRYGCLTTALRVPKHLVDDVRQFILRKLKAKAKSNAAG